jgi:predicted secreted hydrolase
VRGRSAAIWATAILASGALAVGLLRPWEGRESGPLPAGITVAEALRGNPTGFARARAPRSFSFPQDHGPHPDYRTEWWYFTGNLETPQGRHFGYELTMFRIGLAPKAPERASRWAANEVYLAHFAVTDVAGQSFRAFERLTRGALGLAGASATPFRVWVEDWSAEGRATDALSVHLRAAEEGAGIDLLLESTKPPVLQGDGGLSQKSAEPGNASYYYSMTRMPTSGTLRVGAQTFQVQGLSWMDREWGTSALSPEQAGWDWFALQLSDGRDLMFYRLRRRDGSVDPFSAGSLVGTDGRAIKLARGDVHIEVLDQWASPDGVRYPSRWRLSVPKEGLELDIRPLVPNQELRLSVRYWEGAVGVRGRSRGSPIQGSGYVELAGYGDVPPGAREVSRERRRERSGSKEAGPDTS